MNFPESSRCISESRTSNVPYILTKPTRNLSDTISQDKAAVLAYLRMRHKDPYKGYVLCGIVRAPLSRPCTRCSTTLFQSRTVVHNVLVGSVSFASPGPKAMHNASTAQEVEIVTPSATNFEFRVSCQIGEGDSAFLTSRSPAVERSITYASQPAIDPCFSPGLPVIRREWLQSHSTQ